MASTESAGTLPRDWFDIPAGTPVGHSHTLLSPHVGHSGPDHSASSCQVSAAMGDLQCSVKSTLENIDTDAVINVSTSAQAGGDRRDQTLTASGNN